MFAVGGGGALDVDAEPLAAAEAESAPPSPVAPPVLEATGFAPSTFTAGCVGDGVDAAVSPTDGGTTSMAAKSRVGAVPEAVDCEAALVVCAASFEEAAVAPVLGRLCLGCSASDGERDLLRVESASGMAGHTDTQVQRGFSEVRGWGWA